MARCQPLWAPAHRRHGGCLGRPGLPEVLHHEVPRPEALRPEALHPVFVRPAVRAVRPDAVRARRHHHRVPGDVRPRDCPGAAQHLSHRALRAHRPRLQQPRRPHPHRRLLTARSARFPPQPHRRCDSHLPRPRTFPVHRPPAGRAIPVAHRRPASDHAGDPARCDPGAPRRMRCRRRPPPPAHAHHRRRPALRPDPHSAQVKRRRAGLRARRAPRESYRPAAAGWPAKCRCSH